MPSPLPLESDESSSYVGDLSSCLYLIISEVIQQGNSKHSLMSYLKPMWPSVRKDTLDTLVYLEKITPVLPMELARVNKNNTTHTSNILNLIYIYTIITGVELSALLVPGMMIQSEVWLK